MPADDARLLQRADAAQAGRRAEAHGLGELGVGDSRIVLQGGEDLAGRLRRGRVVAILRRFTAIVCAIL